MIYTDKKSSSDACVTQDFVVRESTPPLKVQKTTTQFTPQRLKTLVRPLPLTPSRVSYPINRPLWWDNTHRLLAKMMINNLKMPISQEDIAELKGLAETICASNDVKDILMFLKLLAQFVVFDSQKIFFSTLKHLIGLEPSLAPFFIQVSGAALSSGPSLTPLSISEIFRFYEEEFGHPHGMLSCQPVSQLPNLVDEFLNVDHPEECPMRGWAIYCDKPSFESDAHVVPVFIIRRKKENHLFIFDSLGHSFMQDTRYEMISLSLRSLIDHFQNRDDAAARSLRIYSSQKRRQWSDVGCATFSILDLKHLYERHKEESQHILDFYYSQPEFRQPQRSDVYPMKCVPIFELTVVPPEMMKCVQSLKEFHIYRRCPPILDLVPLSERYLPSDGVEFTKQDFMHCHAAIYSATRVGKVDPSDKSSEGEVKSMNFYIEKKRLANIVILIGRFLSRKYGPAMPVPIKIDFSQLSGDHKKAV